MRPAPLVITMKLMTTRMMKTMTPTAKLPPTKKWPNASITLPAASGPVWPSISTTRLDATLSDRRSSVVNSSTAGKAAKSSAFMVYMLTSSTMMDRAMLKVNSRSSKNGGKGSTIMLRIRMIRMGPTSPLLLSPDMISPASRSHEFGSVMRCVPGGQALPVPAGRGAGAAGCWQSHPDA